MYGKTSEDQEHTELAACVTAQDVSVILVFQDSSHSKTSVVDALTVLRKSSNRCRETVHPTARRHVWHVYEICTGVSFPNSLVVIDLDMWICV